MTAHSYTLAPASPPWEPWEPSEAELLAMERCYAIAKDMGVLDRLRDLRALQQQVREGSAFLGEIG